MEATILASTLDGDDVAVAVVAPLGVDDVAGENFALWKTSADSLLLLDLLPATSADAASETFYMNVECICIYSDKLIHF